MMWPFKKKELYPEKLGADLGMPSDNLGLETKPVNETYDKLKEPLPQEFPSTERSQPLQQFSQNTDIQLVSAKLDTIKAMLDVINQRMTALEKDIEAKQKQKLW